jgi:DNA-binding NarL/FixJ family response regulator
VIALDTSIAAQEPARAVETDKVGRPCKYETHVETRLQEIYRWLKEGMTDYSIADNLGIHQVTWIRYKANLNNPLTY